jgi:hypothetical protein
MNTAEIINNIPKNMGLNEYFLSLNIFDKRKLINELEFSKSIYSKNLNRNLSLASFSYLISFLCFWGIAEAWFAFYLILINLPLSVILFVHFKNYNMYNKKVLELENLIISEGH